MDIVRRIPGAGGALHCVARLHPSTPHASALVLRDREVPASVVRRIGRCVCKQRTEGEEGACVPQIVSTGACVVTDQRDRLVLPGARLATVVAMGRRWRAHWPFSNLLLCMSVLLAASCGAAQAHSQAVTPAGNPVAATDAMVVAVAPGNAGSARFTVLSPWLIRLEWSSTTPPTFEDEATYMAVNRRTAVPAFSHATDSSSGITTLNTSALSLWFDARAAAAAAGSGGSAFTDASLSIRMSTPNAMNASLWRPSRSSAGNLLGTFHNLDRMDGWQDFNCSDKINGMGPGNDYAHWFCAMGLISRAGFAVVDDSRTVVFDNETDWVKAQDNGECPAGAGPNATSNLPCFYYPETPFGQPQNQTLCERAGCCWRGLGPTASRVPLLAYWSAAATDNVLTTAAHPPAQGGYSRVGTVGYVSNSSSGGADYNELQLWYSSARRDHWTTATPEGAAAAKAAGYDFIATLGYLPQQPLPGQEDAMTEAVLYYSEKRQDHFSSLNKCAGCLGGGYDKEWSLGWAFDADVDECVQRSGNVDTYFFGHGVGVANFRAALKDFTSLSGSIPIPRRHMLGVSWSRWSLGTPGSPWMGNSSDMIAAVKGLTNASFPLDTFIFDMNWHIKPDWTGYTWDRELYSNPGPEQLNEWLHDQGLQIGFNIHDCHGVMPVEKRYGAVARALGLDPTANATIDFHGSDQSFMDALHNEALEPLMGGPQGIDFIWTDWQQELQGSNVAIGTTDMTGLNPTMILNHYRFSNFSQPGSTLRGAQHSRFGGLGGHRYPTQFGGDVVQSWESLSFFAYHVSTSANVGVGYWAEEIMSGGGPDHERYARVIQFGAWSPIFTVWGNKNEPCNLWSDEDFPQPYRAAAQAALAHRAMTLPYRYTLAARAHETGVSATLPMYWHWPWDESAYANATRQQFMLGDNVLVSPVYQPLSCGPNCTSGTSTQAVWLPPDASDWLPAFADSPAAVPTPAAGAGWANVSSTLAQVPVFVRAGTVVPMLRYDDAVAIGSASRAFDPLVWTVYSPGDAPGAQGTSLVYEDDGMSNDYLDGAAVTLNMSWHVNSSGCVVYTVESSGTYSGAPTSRQYLLRVIAPKQDLPAAGNARVTVDGEPLPALPRREECSDGAAEGHWCAASTQRRSGWRARRADHPASILPGRADSAGLGELIVSLPRDSAHKSRLVEVCAAASP